MKKTILILFVTLIVCGCTSYKNEMVEFAKPICSEYITYVKKDPSLTKTQKEVKILNAKVVLNEQVTE